MGRPSLLTVGGKAHVETITAGPDEKDQVQPLEPHLWNNYKYNII